MVGFMSNNGPNLLVGLFELTRTAREGSRPDSRLPADNYNAQVDSKSQVLALQHLSAGSQCVSVHMEVASARTG